jgi:alkyl hydroperoxide reductase subunit AhpC
MLQIGDEVPEFDFFTMGENGPEKVNSKKNFEKKVVLFGIPGAFTVNFLQIMILANLHKQPLSRIHQTMQRNFKKRNRKNILHVSK